MTEEKESANDQQNEEDKTSANSSISKEQEKQSPKTPDKNTGRAKKNMRVGRQRTLREKWRLTSLSNKTISIATVVIAGASLLQFGTAIFQWLEMRGAGKQTDKIIAADERLAAAMENSVKEAGKSLDATIEQAHLDQRAWIAATEISGTPEVGKTWIVTAIFQNTGKTIGRNVRITYAFREVPKDKQPDFRYAGESQIPTGHGILSPASFAVSRIKIASGIPLPQSAVEGFKAGDPRLFVYGDISYEDIFGKAHTTTYCSVYNGPTNSFVTCQSHNDAN